ncbi:MAG: TrkH family potassium uptake protein [Thermovirgaceae bacterium]
MRVRVLLKVLALMAAIVSLFMLWPLAWALKDGTEDVKAFLASIFCGLSFAGVLYALGRRAGTRDLGVREAFAAVSLSWIMASVIGALPFLFYGSVPTYTDAFFEAMSGFTTTGASVLQDIQSNPRGILFWRDLTHWLGGMGIIVLSLAVLPFLGVGGMQLYRAEVPGPTPEKLTPRVRQTALLLWGVYLLFSLLETTLLLLGGMEVFEALTHTFGTMATGGFSPLNASIGQYNSSYFDWVIIVFMFLAGANFALHYLMLTGKLSAWWKDEEFRFYVKILIFSIGTASALLYASGTYETVMDSLRYGAFQVVSIITTTGYVTADYEKWPFYIQYLLLFLMFVGGCAGSTGGGMKNIRIMLLAKQVKGELHRLLHPKAVIPVRVGKKAISTDVMGSVTAFFALYMGLFALAALVMAALGVDVLTAIASVAATIGNIGPGLGTVGPTENYAHIPTAGKWVLSFCMLLGRLEIYTVMILFLPAAWRR